MTRTPQWLRDRAARVDSAFKHAIDSTGFRVVEKLAALVAVITFIVLLIDRSDQADFQAWSLINLQAGKIGNGGQTKALERIANGRGVVSSLYIPNTDMSGLELDNAKLLCSNFDQTFFYKSRILNSEIAFTDMKQAQFTESTIERTTVQGANLSRSIFYQSKIRSTSFEDSLLDDAVFSGATLSRVSFRRTVLAGARFNGAKFSQVDFNGANISGAEFDTDPVTARANGMTKDMFRNACADPDSLPSIPAYVTAPSRCSGGSSSSFIHCDAVGRKAP